MILRKTDGRRPGAQGAGGGQYPADISLFTGPTKHRQILERPVGMRWEGHWGPERLQEVERSVSLLHNQ